MQSQDVAVVSGDFVHLALESRRLDDLWSICWLWRLLKGATGEGCELPTEEMGDSRQNTDWVFDCGEVRWADAPTHLSLHISALMLQLLYIRAPLGFHHCLRPLFMTSALWGFEVKDTQHLSVFSCPDNLVLNSILF